MNQVHEEPKTNSTTLVCPSCGSSDPSRIVYGLPIIASGEDHESYKKRNKVKFDGCLVRRFTHYCNSCKSRFYR